MAGSLEFKPDGSIVVGPAFRRAQAAWNEGLAAIARAGAGVIIDEVFLDGGHSQARLRAALEGLTVVWVGVRCHPAVAADRERRRGDRMTGLAREQAARVHEGVSYDIEVDTTDTPTADWAALIAARLEGRH